MAHADDRPSTPAPAAAGTPVAILLVVAAAGLLAASLAGSAGDHHWLLDLASHFRGLYLLAAGLVIAAAAWCRSRPALGLATAALAWNAWLTLPYLPLPTVAPAPPPAGDGRPIRVVSLNVHLHNDDVGAVLDYLRGREADVVALVEVDEAWAPALAELGDHYPHQFVRPRNDPFGVAILSAWPLVAPRAAHCGDAPWPALVAEIDRKGGRFTMVVVHPHPPLDAGTDRQLNAHLRCVARLVAAVPGPCVVAGDFNATPWSAPFRGFTAGSGLVDTAVGRGIQPTWHAGLWPLRIPIDHIFVSRGSTVLDRRVGPHVGSDHFPIEAEFHLPVAVDPR